MGLLVNSSGEDLLGIFVGLESKVVDVLGIQSSSQASLGVLGGLAGLGFSVDEDVVGFLESLGGSVEDFLGILKVILGSSNIFPFIVDVGHGEPDNFVGGLKDIVSFGLESISLGSSGSSFVDLGLGTFFLRSSEVEGKSGLSVELLGSFCLSLLVVDNPDGSIDSA